MGTDSCTFTKGQKAAWNGDFTKIPYGMPVIELIDKDEIKATVGQDPYLMGYTAMGLCYGAKYPTESFPSPYNLGPCVYAPVDTGVGILYKEDVQMYKSAPKF